jgi:hypothetical protein
LGYGISDFVGGIASRRVAALKVAIVSYPVALILLTVLAASMGGHLSAPRRRARSLWDSQLFASRRTVLSGSMK